MRTLHATVALLRDAAASLGLNIRQDGACTTAARALARGLLRAHLRRVYSGLQCAFHDFRDKKGQRTRAHTAVPYPQKTKQRSSCG